MKLNFINLHNTKKVAYKVLNSAITYKELIRMISATTKATEKTSNRNQ